MKYKILIRYKSSLDNLWKIYGTTTTSGSSVTFTEFETDDKEQLIAEIKKLDKELGNAEIRVITDVSYNVGITLDDDKSE